MKIGPWRLEVAYRLGRRDIDELIRKAVGKRDWASGGGLGDRDMSFDFATEQKMLAAKKKLEKVGVTGLRISMHYSKPD